MMHEREEPIVLSKMCPDCGYFTCACAVDWIDCPTCTYRAFDAFDLTDHAELNHG